MNEIKNLDIKNRALITDLYELTMAGGYFENRLNFEATFDLFVRKLPPNRGYLIAAGVEEALRFLSELHFESDEIDYLRKQPVFKNVSDDFFDYLKTFRFTGEVWAMQEGTLFFEDEPLLRVTAPIIEAQIVETYLLCVINVSCMAASKASRVVESARGRPVADFGSRRAHGPEASIRTARACYLAGCSSTSNVYAGYAFGIPISGTSAHSWVMAHDSEKESFENYIKVYPEHTIFLIDTYDIISGTKNAISLNKKFRGVRIDSGDIVKSSKEVRRILDEAGLNDAKIFASGDLDEYEITRLLENGALVDMFGVGTKMVTSNDAPYLNVVYKLVETSLNGEVKGKVKFSEDKLTIPYKKQVWRKSDDAGFYTGDVITMAHEKVEGAEPLLEKYIENGAIVKSMPPLSESREWVRHQLSKLPNQHREIHNPAKYPVEHSQTLLKKLDKLRTEYFANAR